jgi:hypothetical protein
MIRQNSPWQWLILFCGVIWMVGCTISVDSRTAAPAMASPSPISPATPSPTGLATPGEPGRIDLSEGLYIRQIRPDAFIVTHEFPWPANSLIVEMENSDLVWVGTPYTPAATNEVLDWIETRWGKRNIVAINTGYHVDNLGGNSALIEHGITVWGSDLTAQLLEERGEQTRQVILAMLQGSGNERYYLAHKDIPYVAPTQLFPIADGLELQFGNDKIQVYYPGHRTRRIMWSSIFRASGFYLGDACCWLANRLGILPMLILKTGQRPSESCFNSMRNLSFQGMASGSTRGSSSIQSICSHMNRDLLRITSSGTPSEITVES